MMIILSLLKLQNFIRYVSNKVCAPIPHSRYKNLGGGVLLVTLGGGVLPGSPNPDPILDQKCNFPHPFSDQNSKIHTRFQTRPLGRNYDIIT